MRILGVNIPDNKKVEIALMYFYGIGRPLARTIIQQTGVDSGKRMRELAPEEVNRIKEYIERRIRVEGELRQIVRQNINRLKELQTYRGTRHARRLPARGQRTRTNSRTVRGNVRKTAGSGKRKVELK